MNKTALESVVNGVSVFHQRTQIQQEVFSMLRRLLTVILGITITFLMAVPSYAFRDSIAAAWTFDEGAGDVIHDVSGNGNDGALMGGAEWIDGQFEKALHFDASTSYVEIPFAESMRVLNQGDFTFAAWFIADEVPGSNRVVCQHLDGNGTGRTWLYIVGGTGEIATHVGGSRTPSGFNVTPGEWYHVAVVVTEGGGTDTVQIYVNGEPAGAQGQLGMEDSEGAFHIGAHKNPANNVWFGIIDDVAIINKALSQAEVKDLMANGILGAAVVEPAGKLALSWGSIKGNTMP
jgi:hypothetical protein